MPNELQNSYSQQSQNKGLLSILTGQAEFSKKMVVLDTICYVTFTIVCILLVIFVPSFIAICPDLVTILTTGFVSLRLGYSAKATVENYKKLSSTFSNQSAEKEEEEEEIDNG